MKTTYFIRHAKSFWEVPAELEDIDRPLAERGWRDSAAIARHLAQSGLRLDAIYSSPAVRAYSTARRIAAAQNLPAEKIYLRSALYEASPQAIFSELQKIDEAYTCIAVFGHNPEFTQLAQFFLDIENLPTSAYFALRWDIKSWQELGVESPCQLHAFMTPKKLKEG